MTAVFADVLEQWEPPDQYLDPWYDWVDDAAGQTRCTNVDWEVEDIDGKNNEIIISYDGEDAHSGTMCGGNIFSDLDGNIKDVSTA